METVKHLVHIVIYRYPSDFPDHIVVRPWIVTWHGVAPMPIACLCQTVEEARDGLEDRGFICVPPTPGMDPVIVEMWI